MKCKRCGNDEKFSVKSQQVVERETVITRDDSITTVITNERKVVEVTCLACGYLTNDPSDFGYSGELTNPDTVFQPNSSEPKLADQIAEQSYDSVP